MVEVEDVAFDKDQKHPISVLLQNYLPQSPHSAPPAPVSINNTVNNKEKDSTVEEVDFSLRKYHTLKPSKQTEHVDENSKVNSEKDDSSDNSPKPSRNPFDPSRLPSNMRLSRQRSRSQLVIPVIPLRLNVTTPTVVGDENLPRTPHDKSSEIEQKSEEKKEVSESSKGSPTKEVAPTPGATTASNVQHDSLFGKLPIVLLHLIVVFLETSVDVCRFMLACKFIKDVVDDEEMWSDLCCDKQAIFLQSLVRRWNHEE
eukprot:TRINITY_DN8794_c0_g1_i1.p1 TRINITY_DN8794_c0_g1~~TRINITY_DN8794_c0_g1_i1.p1  ORF type:complete len:257 (-),score=59.62 TRINITY_DN8794_c0_g1_i1:104-874(-)